MVNEFRTALLLALSCAPLAACRDSSAPDTTAVDFVLVAPLCSSVLPVELFVDGRVVVTDTFRVAVSNPHTVSRSFPVSPGRHVLDAHVIGGYVWPTDTTSVLSGSIATDTLQFYCS
jgi:hypothetical protein